MKLPELGGKLKYHYYDVYVRIKKDRKYYYQTRCESKKKLQLIIRLLKLEDQLTEIIVQEVEEYEERSFFSCFRRKK